MQELVPFIGVVSAMNLHNRLEFTHAEKSQHKAKHAIQKEDYEAGTRGYVQKSTLRDHSIEAMHLA